MLLIAPYYYYYYYPHSFLKLNLFTLSVIVNRKSAILLITISITRKKGIR